jgi:hypothetical protein
MGTVSRIRSLEIGKIAEEVVAGVTTLPIEPRQIATDRQITIRSWEPEKQGISGFLMKQGDSFGIGYSTKIKNDGYINFTISHELGHYHLPGHVEKLFANGSGIHMSKSGFVSDDTCEREADLFAATLLMPERLLRPAIRIAGQGFPAIETLSTRCVTSITSTAIRYADFAEDPVAVIVSSGGNIEYCCLSSAIRELSGLTWPKRGDLIPITSTTARFQRTPDDITNGERAGGFSMLDEWVEGAPRVEMKEDVVGLGHYGKSLTVLFTDEPIEPEGPDEPEDSYEHSRRWERRG